MGHPPRGCTTTSFFLPSRPCQVGRSMNLPPMAELDLSGGLVLAHDVEKEGVHEHFGLRLEVVGIDRVGNLEQVLAQIRLPSRPHQLEEVRTGTRIVENLKPFADELREQGGHRTILNADEASIEVQADVGSVDRPARGVTRENGVVWFGGFVSKSAKVAVR